jgi:hypothetical protein
MLHGFTEPHPTNPTTHAMAIVNGKHRRSRFTSALSPPTDDAACESLDDDSVGHDGS